MNNLDDTFVKMVQEKSEKVTKDKELLRQKVYQKSIQNGSMNQKVSGELYVGRNPKMQHFVRGAITVGCVVASAVIVSSIVKSGKNHEMVSSYNQIVSNTIESELSRNEQMNFNEEFQEMSRKEKLAEIEEQKELLRETGNYDVFGNNKVEGSRRTVKDPDAIFQFNDLEQDAIENAAVDKVEEYQGRGM